MIVQRIEDGGKVITKNACETASGTMYDIGVVPDSGHGALIFKARDEKAADEIISLLQQVILRTH